MTMPFDTECAIARDLQVAYAAGDVSPQTRDWLNSHLSRCPNCRQALDELLDASGAVRQQPAPVPPVAPGPRLVGRVRRNVIILITAVLLSLALAAGGITFGVYSIIKAAGMNIEHPVPLARTLPQSVIEQVDLASLQLKPISDDRGKNYAGRIYRSDRGDLQAVVYATQSPSTRQAHEYFQAWFEGYGSRTLSVETITPSHAVAKFRSQGKYLYGWQEGPWVITIEVWGSGDDLTVVRDQVRDAVFAAVRNAE